MSGNVWEWVWDWFGPYPDVAQTDPTGPDDGNYRVLRGGRWLSTDWSVRLANRNNVHPAARQNHYGFRLARP